MTVLTGTFVDVAEKKATGFVTVSVEMSRPAYSGSGFIVTTQRHKIPLVDGAFVSPDLDPGPVLVEVEAPGFFERFAVNLPMDGEHDLHGLLEAAAEYTPPVVERAEAASRASIDAARRSGESAEDASGHADRAGEHRRVVDGVVADGAAAVRQHVEDEAVRAESAAGAAGASAGRSETAASAAVDAKTAAEDAQGRAGQHETAAAGFADTASTARDEAVSARDGAVSAHTGAESARDSAVSARTSAESARDEAEAKAGAAAAIAAAEKIAELVGDAPEALDTIYELAEYVKGNRDGLGALEAALNNRVVGAYRIVVQDEVPGADTPLNQITFVRGEY